MIHSRTLVHILLSFSMTILTCFSPAGRPAFNSPNSFSASNLSDTRNMK